MKVKIEIGFDEEQLAKITTFLETLQDRKNKRITQLEAHIRDLEQKVVRLENGITTTR